MRRSHSQKRQSSTHAREPSVSYSTRRSLYYTDSVAPYQPKKRVSKAKRPSKMLRGKTVTFSSSTNTTPKANQQFDFGRSASAHQQRNSTLGITPIHTARKLITRSQPTTPHKQGLASPTDQPETPYTPPSQSMTIHSQIMDESGLPPMSEQPHITHAHSSGDTNRSMSLRAKNRSRFSREYRKTDFKIGAASTRLRNQRKNASGSRSKTPLGTARISSSATGKHHEQDSSNMDDDFPETYMSAFAQLQASGRDRTSDKYDTAVPTYGAQSPSQVYKPFSPSHHSIQSMQSDISKPVWNWTTPRHEKTKTGASMASAKQLSFSQSMNRDEKPPSLHMGVSDDGSNPVTLVMQFHSVPMPEDADFSDDGDLRDTLRQQSSDRLEAITPMQSLRQFSSDNPSLSPIGPSPITPNPRLFEVTRTSSNKATPTPGMMMRLRSESSGSADGVSPSGSPNEIPPGGSNTARGARYANLPSTTRTVVSESYIKSEIGDDDPYSPVPPTDDTPTLGSHRHHMEMSDFTLPANNPVNTMRLSSEYSGLDMGHPHSHHNQMSIGSISSISNNDNTTEITPKTSSPALTSFFTPPLQPSLAPIDSGRPLGGVLRKPSIIHEEEEDHLQEEPSRRRRGPKAGSAFATLTSMSATIVQTKHSPSPQTSPIPETILESPRLSENDSDDDDDGGFVELPMSHHATQSSDLSRGHQMSLSTATVHVITENKFREELNSSRDSLDRIAESAAKRHSLQIDLDYDDDQLPNAKLGIRHFSSKASNPIAEENEEDIMREEEDNASDDDSSSEDSRSWEEDGDEMDDEEFANMQRRMHPSQKVSQQGSQLSGNTRGAGQRRSSMQPTIDMSQTGRASFALHNIIADKELKDERKKTLHGSTFHGQTLHSMHENSVSGANHPSLHNAGPSIEVDDSPVGNGPASATPDGGDGDNDKALKEEVFTPRMAALKAKEEDVLTSRRHYCKYYLIGALIAAFIQGVSEIMFVVYAVEVFATSTTKVGFVVAIYGVVVGCAGVVWCWLADNPSIGFSTALTINVCLLPLFIAVQALSALLNSVTILYIAYISCGLFTASWPLTLAVTSLLLDQNDALQYQTILQLGGILPQTLGYLMAGILYWQTGNYWSIYITLAIIGSVGCILVMLKVSTGMEAILDDVQQHTQHLRYGSKDLAIDADIFKHFDAQSGVDTPIASDDGVPPTLSRLQSIEDTQKNPGMRDKPTMKALKSVEIPIKWAGAGALRRQDSNRSDATTSTYASGPKGLQLEIDDEELPDEVQIVTENEILPAGMRPVKLQRVNTLARIGGAPMSTRTREQIMWKQHKEMGTPRPRNNKRRSKWSKYFKEVFSETFSIYDWVVIILVNIFSFFKSCCGESIGTWLYLYTITTFPKRGSLFVLLGVQTSATIALITGIILSQKILDVMNIMPCIRGLNKRLGFSVEYSQISEYIVSLTSMAVIAWVLGVFGPQQAQPKALLNPGLAFLYVIGVIFGFMAACNTIVQSSFYLRFAHNLQDDSMGSGVFESLRYASETGGASIGPLIVGFYWGKGSDQLFYWCSYFILFAMATLIIIIVADGAHSIDCESLRHGQMTNKMQADARTVM